MFNIFIILKGLNPGLAIAELKKLLSGTYGEPSKNMAVVGQN